MLHDLIQNWPKRQVQLADPGVEFSAEAPHIPMKTVIRIRFDRLTLHTSKIIPDAAVFNGVRLHVPLQKLVSVQLVAGVLRTAEAERAGLSEEYPDTGGNWIPVKLRDVQFRIGSKSVQKLTEIYLGSWRKAVFGPGFCHHMFMLQSAVPSEPMEVVYEDSWWVRGPRVRDHLIITAETGQQYYVLENCGRSFWDDVKDERIVPGDRLTITACSWLVYDRIAELRAGDRIYADASDFEES